MSRVFFGNAKEQEAFAARHREFMAHAEKSLELINRVVGHKRALETPVDKVVYTLGRIGADEFWEIVPTAANGYGIAALKLLRPLFEKTVTMKYLIAHPDKIDDFLDYFWVNARRSMSHMKDAGYVPEKLTSPEQVKEIEAGFAKVRDRYIEEVCKKCGTTRTMGSWTKLNLADMAKHVGIGRTYMAFCYIPTLQIHATMQGLMNWTRQVADGAMEVGGHAQHNQADVAVVGAHLCLSLILEAHIEHFGVAVPIDEVRRNFGECWPTEAKEVERDAPTA